MLRPGLIMEKIPFGSAGGLFLCLLAVSASCSSSTAPPVAMQPPGVLAVGDYHRCAVVAGAVQCWGNDSQGQLGSEEFGSSPGIKEVRFPR